LARLLTLARRLVEGAINQLVKMLHRLFVVVVLNPGIDPGLVLPLLATPSSANSGGVLATSIAATRSIVAPSTESLRLMGSLSRFLQRARLPNLARKDSVVGRDAWPINVLQLPRTPLLRRLS
jgi:hypothetical protein